jgi:regulation of enolase protein 1 (concanavalin A-like superfamily)
MGPDGRATLRVVAPGRTDMFHDPAGGAPVRNAPRGLGVPPPGDFRLSARVSVGFAETFDAGVLLVWAGERHWAKLCFEYSPQGEGMAVSVVTRDLSDDANGFTVGPGERLWLRVSRVGAAWAFHAHSRDRPWSLVRHFSLDEPIPATVGFEAQSPLGTGCTVTFDEIAFTAGTLADLRNGA